VATTDAITGTLVVTLEEDILDDDDDNEIGDEDGNIGKDEGDGSMKVPFVGEATKLETEEEGGGDNTAETPTVTSAFVGDVIRGGSALCFGIGIDDVPFQIASSFRASSASAAS
jgi:hypothetical protein